jgi:uncharacterized protein
MVEYLLQFLADFWSVLMEMSPYLLLGFAVAGLLSIVLSPKLIERHLGGRGIVPCIKAAAFGVPLPLCSCGVIPVSASLRRHGAGKGATTSFLISTPQTGVDSILVTFSLLGVVFAIFRPLIALASGVLGGVVVSRFAGQSSADPSDCCGSGQGHAEEQVHGESCSADDSCGESCQGEHEEDAGPGGFVARLVDGLRYGFGELPADIGKALLVGLVISAAISAFVPEGFFAEHLGRGVLAMGVMMLLGVPMYVCATASVPIAAALVLDGGVTPGAALVFLMTGPATNAATLATIWRVMGKRTAVLYLLTVIGCAFAGGLLLDGIFDWGGYSPGRAVSQMLPTWLKYGGAIGLLAVLGWAIIRPLFKRNEADDSADGLDRLVLDVEGMTCSHCSHSVQRALLEQSGVDAARVDLKGGRATVTGEDLDTDTLIAAVESLGYQARARQTKEKE